MKASLTPLLLAALLMAPGQAEPDAIPPTAASEPVRTAPATYRRAQESAIYLRESFGVLPLTVVKPPVVPPQATREETFAILLKSLRDKRMESSRERANRLGGSDHPQENEALTFLTQALGGANASNPVARSVQRHLASEAGRQELLIALGVSQNHKSR